MQFLGSTKKEIWDAFEYTIKNSKDIQSSK